jgi:hypothetical protein
MKTPELARALLLVITALLLAACPNGMGTDPVAPDQASDEPGDIPKYFWGSWVRMDRDDLWYFSDGDVTINGESRYAWKEDASTVGANNIIATRRTDNMVVVKPTDSLEFYLFRQRGANASVQSAVRSTSSGSRSLVGGMAGITTIVSNLDNDLDTQETESGTDGEVAYSDLIPGDEYIIQVPVQDGVPEAFEVPVVPGFDGENIGIVNVSDVDQNFKVSYEVTNAGDWDFLYGDTTYDLTIRITNIGTEDMLSADYAISPPAGLNLTGAGLTGILGTVPADGGVRELNFVASATGIQNDYVDFVVPVSIVSVDGRNQWDDNMTIRVFRRPMDIYFRTSATSVQGIVITPERRSLTFSTFLNSTGKITVPQRDVPYTLALTGANYDSETKYTVRIGSEPLDDGSALETATINEPNDDESESTPVPLGQEFAGYLGVYDLDFYSLLPGFEPGAPIPWNWLNISDPDYVNAYDGYELSWQSIWGATYELQVAMDDATFAGATTHSQSESTFVFGSEHTSASDLYVRLRAVDEAGTRTAWSDTLHLPVWSGTVGDIGPGGGVVFYDNGSFREPPSGDDSDGWRYLEAAPTDASAGAQWGASGDLVFTGEPVGYGEGNTEYLLNYKDADGNDVTTPAAEAAANYQSDGFTDWFLPSRNELLALYAERTVGMNLQSAYYWSSSHYGFTDDAIRVNLGGGTEQIADRTESSRVRAIRGF